MSLGLLLRSASDVHAYIQTPRLHLQACSHTVCAGICVCGCAPLPLYVCVCECLCSPLFASVSESVFVVSVSVPSKSGCPYQYPYLADFLCLDVCLRLTNCSVTNQLAVQAVMLSCTMFGLLHLPAHFLSHMMPAQEHHHVSSSTSRPAGGLPHWCSCSRPQAPQRLLASGS